MPVTSIQRDFAQTPNIVRIGTSDSLVAIVTAGYWTSQQTYVHALQHGNFVWVDGDLVAINYANGDGFFTFDSDTQAFVPESLGASSHGIAVAGTTANLNAVYANGSAGVGATLTNNGALAAFVTDGITPTLSQRILVKNQSTAAQNGVYVLTTLGTGAIAWVLTRATDFDSSANIEAGDVVIVGLGTTLAGSSWMQQNVVTTVGTDPIAFTNVSATFPITVPQGGIGLTAVTLGGMLYGSASNVYTVLAGNVTTTKEFLSQTGSGAVSAAPVWSTIAASDLGGFTAGSVIFASATGFLTQDNPSFFFNDTTNRLGLGTVTPIAPLQIVGNVSDFQLVASDISTNASIKNFRMGMMHYTNAELPLTMIYSFMDGADSVVNLGGGTGFGNAATSVDTYAAATTTAGLGTLVTSVTTSGLDVLAGHLQLAALTASTALIADASKNITSVALTNGQLLMGSTAANPVAAALTAGSGVSVTNAAGSITIAMSGGGVAWSNVTTATVAMVVNNGYITSVAASIVLTLPVTSAIGDTIKIRGNTATQWVVAQNAGQIIHIGNQPTTTGVVGLIASTNAFDCVDLTCIVANTEWTCSGIQSAGLNFT